MAQDGVRQSAEEQIRRTIAEFGHLTDAGDFDGWVRLFVEDGGFHMFGQSHVGHDALRSFIEIDQPPDRRGLHLTTDSLIEVDHERATARSNFIFVAWAAAGPLVAAAGQYHDVLVPRGGCWLFQEREAVLIGPTAAQQWGAARREDPHTVPWYAVRRSTPPDRRGTFPDADPSIASEG
jgi:3-phenylpropionate/cinnamic acid dioxygenase small subunit